MQFKFLTLTALLTLTTAQNLGSEPACATACLSSAITAAGCAATDQGCQCGPTQASIGNLALGCLVASCPATAIAAIQSIGLALCAQYSAALTVGSLTVTTTATAVAVATTTTKTSTAIGLPTSTPSPTVAGGNATVVITTSGTASGTAVVVGGNGTVTTPSVKTGTSTAASSPATSSSAAMALLVNGMGGLAAAFFGVLAAL